MHTCLGDTDDITILQSDGYGLTLDGRWVFVADIIDTVQDCLRDIRFRPRSKWVGDVAT